MIPIQNKGKHDSHYIRSKFCHVADVVVPEENRTHNFPLIHTNNSSKYVRFGTVGKVTVLAIIWHYQH